MNETDYIESNDASEELPEPDGEWLPGVKADWNDFWNSPIAAYMDPIHIPALKRLFYYRSSWLETKNEIQEANSSLIAGSNGNRVLNPLIRSLRDLETQIQTMETQYGLTLKSATQLGIELGTETLTWQQVANAAIAASPEPVTLSLPAKVIEEPIAIG